MLGKLAAGVAGLGLIGGAGTVVYNNHGDATVKIKNEKTGRVQRVRIKAGGKSFLCPVGIDDKLKPYDLVAGRIRLTLRQVRREEHVLLAQYPGGAPASVVTHFNTLHRRDDRLVAAYNREIRGHNAVLRHDCTAG